MIYLTGDTHGDWMSRLNTKNFPKQKEMTKDDYVIILGDFGIWDNSNAEKHALDWLGEKPFTTLFLSGNHDNYDILDRAEVKMWHGGKVNFIRPSIIHLMRGQVFEIEEKRFFTFGGASCHDIKDGILEPDDPRIKEWSRYYSEKLFRVNHVSWWERELPSQEEMLEGIENLKRSNNQVDYILTHCPYTSLLQAIDPGLNFYEKDFLTEWLEKIKKTVQYKEWFFGHMHMNYRFTQEDAICLFEKIIDIDNLDYEDI